MHSIENPAGSEPAIQVTGLVKTYGDVRAVDGVSFEVNPGTVFGLLAPTVRARPRPCACSPPCSRRTPVIFG